MQHDNNKYFSFCLILKVTRLCDLSVEGDSVTSVGWSERVSITLPSEMQFKCYHRSCIALRCKL